MAFVDLCRLCGTDTLNIVRNAIFEGEGRVKKYALKISECLTLKVAEEDQLPKIMCGECSYKLDLLSDFRDVAYKTETQLLSKIDVNKVKAELPDVMDSPDLDNDDFGGDDNSCSSSPEPLPEPLVEIKEEENLPKKRSPTKRSWRVLESEGEEMPVKKRGRPPKQPPATTSKATSATPAAASTTPVAAPPKENSGTDRETEDAALDCQMCRKHFPSEEDLQLHWRTCINSGGELKVMVQRLTDEQVLACQADDDSSQSNSTPEVIESSMKCSTDASLQIDDKTHLSHTLFRCARCVLVYFSLKTLRKHYKESHLSAVCKICKELLPNLLLLKSHMKRHIKTGLSKILDEDAKSMYNCLKCSKKFKQGIYLEMHNILQHNAKPTTELQCLRPKCNQLFPNGDALLAHIKEVHEGSSQIKSTVNFVPFKCSSCPSSFPKLDDLQLHQINAHSIWPHKCALCGKGYFALSHFKQHTKAHKTGAEGVVKCLHCSETFSRSSGRLMDHMRHHWPTVRCNVEDCEFFCNSRWDLQKHKSSVHSIWSFNCHLCSQGFDRSGDLKLHVYSHQMVSKSLPSPSSLNTTRQLMTEDSCNPPHQDGAVPNQDKHQTVIIIKSEFNEEVFE